MKKIIKSFPKKLLFFISIISMISNCNTQVSNPTASPSSTISNNNTTGVGVNSNGVPQGVKIIFNQNTGSFLISPGTTGVVSANQFFYTDNTVMPSIPSWLSSVNVTISDGNISANECAKFASDTENTTQCTSINPINPSSPQQVPCGGPAGFFRVSEVDCLVSNAAGFQTPQGNGSGTDPVFIQVVFNRGSMPASNNVLATLEYSAATIGGPIANPGNCLDNFGNLAPENCADFTWRAYLKHSTLDIAKSFMLLFPPYIGTSLPIASSTGSLATGLTFSSRQMVLPLASDSSLSVLQLSRIGSNYNTSNGSNSILSLCMPSRTTGDSPLCAGVVIYSLTLILI